MSHNSYPAAKSITGWSKSSVSRIISLTHNCNRPANSASVYKYEKGDYKEEH